MKHYHVLYRDLFLGHCTTSCINHIWRIILVEKWLMKKKWLVSLVSRVDLVVKADLTPSTNHSLSGAVISTCPPEKRLQQNPPKGKVRAKSFHPFETYESNWIISPGFGMKKNFELSPPSIPMGMKTICPTQECLIGWEGDDLLVFR